MFISVDNSHSFHLPYTLEFIQQSLMHLLIFRDPMAVMTRMIANPSRPLPAYKTHTLFSHYVTASTPDTITQHQPVRERCTPHSTPPQEPYKHTATISNPWLQSNPFSYKFLTTVDQFLLHQSSHRCDLCYNPCASSYCYCEATIPHKIEELEVSCRR